MKTKSLSILRYLLRIMRLEKYLKDPIMYKNLKDFIMLIVGCLLFIFAIIYIFFIRQEQITMQDFVIIIGYIFAFIAGKTSVKKDV